MNPVETAGDSPSDLARRFVAEQQSHGRRLAYAVHYDELRGQDRKQTLVWEGTAQRPREMPMDELRATVGTFLTSLGTLDDAESAEQVEDVLGHILRQVEAPPTPA